MAKVAPLCWMGQPVAEMSREQLLNVIEELAYQLNEEHQAHKKTLALWSEIAKSRLTRRYEWLI